MPPATLAASSPLRSLLDLSGCAHYTESGVDARHYRVLYRTSTDGGATWGPPVPMTDMWYVFRLVSGVLQTRLMAPDAAGWYELLDPAEGWSNDDRLVLWHSVDGFHELVVEVADAAKSPMPGGTSAPVRLRVDNARPTVTVTGLAYRIGTSGGFTPLPLVCPIVPRRPGETIQLRVTVDASSPHLRSVELYAGGCGGGNPALVAGFESMQAPGSAPTSTYWHKSAADNTLSGVTTLWQISSSLPAGAYRAGATAWSRAFSPAASLFPPNDPQVLADPAELWRSAEVAISIVDV